MNEDKSGPRGAGWKFALLAGIAGLLTAGLAVAL